MGHGLVIESDDDYVVFVLGVIAPVIDQKIVVLEFQIAGHHRLARGQRQSIGHYPQQ